MIDQISSQIERLKILNADRNLIVGISGIDGSGKSTFAKKLECSLAGEGIMTTQINLDDFLHPRAIRHKNPDQIEGYFEDNFDIESLVNGVLDPARNNTLVQGILPVMNLDTDQIVARDFRFNGPGVLIVEGVFLFRSELRDKFDLKIWLDIGFETAMERVLNRVRDQRYGDAAAIRARYETRFFPTQRFHLERDRPSETADYIVNIAQA